MSGAWDQLAVDLGFDGDGGVTNDTEPFVSAPPDASGGTGSFLASLVPTLTNGLNATINSELLNALGRGGNLYTVDANGNVVPKAAASANNAAYRAAVYPAQSPFKSPTFILAAIAVSGFFLWAVAHK